MSGAQRGVELAYAERTTDFTAPSIAQVDVPGLSIVVTEGSRPYWVELEGYTLAGSTAAQVVYALITDAANTLLATAAVRTPANGTGHTARCRVRITPTAPGTVKTYKVRLLGTGTDIPTLSAAATAKATLSAIEV